MNPFVSLDSRIGEKISFTLRAVSAVTSNYVANASPLVTLGPGTWQLFGEFAVTQVASLTWGGTGIATNTASDSTGFINSFAGYVCNASVPVQGPCCPVTITVPEGTTQVLYAKAKTLGANTTISVGGFAVRIA